MKTYYVYKITFVDGCYYYGKRACNVAPEDDTYWGSPVTHKDKWTAMKFHKEIIAVYSSYEECSKAEIEFILPVYKTDPLCLNVGCGRGVNHTSEVRRKISNALRGRALSTEHKKKISKANVGKPMSEEQKQKISEAQRGKVCSAETKKKLSEANKGKNNPSYGKSPSVRSLQKKKESYERIRHQQGEKKNSQFGKMWITNESHSYKINRDDPIPEGYRRGRVIRQQSSVR